MEVVNAIGRRKAAVARVYVSEGKGNITINKKALENYFPTASLQYKVKQPFALTENVDGFDVKVESRQDLIDKPVSHLLIASWSYGEQIKNDLKPLLPENTEILTLNDIVT